MNTFLDDFGRIWVEFWGRGRHAPTISFQDNEIITEKEELRVSGFWNAMYLNLHPTLFAVAISPDGKFIRLNGGYNPLMGGRYTLHYVDGQSRVFTIPKTSETTLDGAKVSLEIHITYCVIDPIKALQVQNAVDTLFVFAHSDLKEFIRSHRHDEIVGGIEGQIPNNSLIGRYMKHQHAGRDIAKLFSITNVVVGEKVGDPKLIEIREKFQIEQRQYVADNELNRQNQELQRIVASQEAEMKRIKTQSDAELQDIRQKMELQKIDLERARGELRLRQEKVVPAMNAIAQALSASTYPRDPREFEIIKDLLGELGAAPGPSATVNPDDSRNTPKTERIDELTNTLLGLLNRKRS